MKTIAVIGSTGSIGTQTLEIVREQKDLKVVALSAGKNIDLLEQQIREFEPKIASVSSEQDAKELYSRIGSGKTEIVFGMDGLIACSTYPDVEIAVMAVVGMIGIRPVIEAIKAGKEIALANKETLVTAGHIIMPLAAKNKVRILPVDSEHSAIFQCLQGNQGSAVEKIILTASGGPFRGKKKEDLINVTASDALKHPNWSMGNKITIDSSTMVNKGLEVIEASWLFTMEPDKIEVVIQPQSIIHSAVQYEDGGIMAQLGVPDMKLPIQYALYYPIRRKLSMKRVNFFELGTLQFERPDLETFRGLALAFESIKAGGSLPTVYNAANEYAVAKFLANQIKFLQIAEFIERAMDRHTLIKEPDLESILETEERTYQYLDSII